MAAQKSVDDELSEGLEPLKVNTEASNICCICQDICVNPVQLPCSHVFCFLCIKGVAARSSHCALCRHKISPEVLDHPDVVNRGEIQSSIKESGESKWYYEAKNGGWWLYEQRTSDEIEKAFNDRKKTLRLQISGFYYIIDFESMVQYREEFPSRRRCIKRDRVNADVIKGVAGITIREKEQDKEEQIRGRESKRKEINSSDVDSQWLRRNETTGDEQDRRVRSGESLGARIASRHQVVTVSMQSLGENNSPIQPIDTEEHQKTRLVTGHD